MMDILKFRARYPWRPSQIAILDGREVEVISYPFTEGDSVHVNVRLTPGDPTTLAEIDADRLASRMTLPTIHLNGTSATSLLEGYCEAAHAIREAIRKVGEAGPNGRDYYPQGGSAIYQAQEEHTSRLTRLQEVLKEIELMAEHVAGQEVRR